ncbi:MAG: hypothetical protein ABI585_13040 [Betaproteobacteria bacterium]
MDTHGEISFAAAQRHAVRGIGNMDPRGAYRQQAPVELSVAGRAWLGERFQAAFDEHGTIPLATLDALDRPTLP